MKGMRPLTDDEITRIFAHFEGKFALRDKALFVLGSKSGLRISELLSLTIGDVMKADRFLDRIYVRRCNVKGKREGRSIPFHPEAMLALAPWIETLRKNGANDSTYIFKSRIGRNRPITRVQAWKLFDRIFSNAGLSGRLGTHFLRKSFAYRAYRKLGNDLFRTQKALGHSSINSTISYLSFQTQEIDAAILSI
jgi:integrase